MKFIFPFIIIASVIFGIITGNISDVTNSILSETKSGIDLFLVISGGMAFWGGIMKISEKSGLVEIIRKLLMPICKFLFKGINPKGEAFKAIVMNITANLLGLGNAATPSGIKAVKELSKEENSNGFATENMAVFIVLNTASIQLLPVTVGTLRLEYGSASPFEIIPCVIVTSLISVVAGILAVKALSYKNISVYAQRKIVYESK